jgi:hypothetical protein
VVTESYDSGVKWTTPTVLNVSVNPAYSGVYFAPAMPAITAFGNTVYVAWERLGSAYLTPPQNGMIAFRLSLNGGTSWYPTIPVTSATAFSQNPSLLVTPSGRLFLAYSTDPFGGSYSSDIVVSTTTSNGTQFTKYTLPGSYANVPLLGPFSAPEVKMAYSALYGELYLTFTAMDYDSNFVYAPQLEFAATPDNGSTWIQSSSATSAAYDPSQTWYGPTGPNYEPGVYAASLATGVDGQVYINALVRNQSLCRGDQCGMMSDVVLNTSDNGTTFSQPTLVNGNVTPGNSSWFGESTATLVAGGHLWVMYPEVTCPTWPSLNCSSGYYYPPMEQSQLTVATPFSGTNGLAITFHPSGLNSTTQWELVVNGKAHLTNGTTDLVVSGFPPGEMLFWATSLVNVSNTLRYYPVSQTMSSTAPITTNVTDTIVFEPFYPYDVTLGGGSGALVQPYCVYGFIYVNYTYQDVYNCATPSSSPCWEIEDEYYQPNYTYNDIGWEVFCADLQVNSTVPLDQEVWAEAGTNFTVSITPRDYMSEIFNTTNGPCSTAPYMNATFYDIFCDIYTSNYVFLSWSGNGNASVATNSSTIRVNLTGPAFETANIIQNGGCNGYWEVYGTGKYNGTYCYLNTTGFTVQESGLPNNVLWGFTLENSTSVENYNGTAPAPILLSGLPVGQIYTMSAATLATNATDMYWVPTLVSGDTAITGFTVSLTVAYTLENITTCGFNLTVDEVGLPSNVQWSFSVSSASTSENMTVAATSLHQYTVHLDYATDYSVWGSMVYTSSLYGFEVTGINESVNTINATWSNYTSAVPFALTGDALVTLFYTPLYWLDVEASAGGSATPASGWIASGSSVKLTETPSEGYYFVGWTGSGPGATGSTQRHQTAPIIRPNGPVTEFAQFGKIPPATYVATFEPTGLPVDQVYTVNFGSSAYSGVGVFTIGNLSAGDYTISVPYVYDNTSLGTRYVASSWTATWEVAGSSVDLTANGTFFVTYVTQYLVSVGSSCPGCSGSGGTITPAAGTYWDPSGTTVPLTATPAAGYQFVSWGGTGSVAVNSTVSSVSLTVEGPISETAVFASLPPRAPATYHLTVTESGLPSNLGWNASVLTTGSSAVGVSLTLNGLNGSYTLTVPTVANGAGIRYVPAGTGSYPVTVKANSSYEVNFTEQFLVTISWAGNGTATPTSSEWVNAGSTVTLTASPDAGWMLQSWNGTGASSYSGGELSTQLTVNSPVTDTATFVQIPHSASTTTTSPTAGLPLAIGLLVALLVAGLLVGAVLVRARRGPPPSTTSEEAWESIPSETPEGETEGGTPPG